MHTKQIYTHKTDKANMLKQTVWAYWLQNIYIIILKTPDIVSLEVNWKKSKVDRNLFHNEYHLIRYISLGVPRFSFTRYTCILSYQKQIVQIKTPISRVYVYAMSGIAESSSVMWLLYGGGCRFLMLFASVMLSLTDDMSISSRDSTQPAESRASESASHVSSIVLIIDGASWKTEYKWGSQLAGVLHIDPAAFLNNHEEMVEIYRWDSRFKWASWEGDNS